MGTRRHQLLAIGLGTGVGVTLYWVGIDILLSSAIAVALAVSVVFLCRINRKFPDRRTGDGWQNGRWMTIPMVVINFAALVGVQLAPLPNEYTAAIAFLIIFVGLSAYLGGSLAEMERSRS
ncbi:hypothetical protein BRD22_08500 [Halobacteriales archaeon SW_8_68_21]|nr:MAG: hypothetical protein BRD22_08500 [Halobacteriales archaeon SW_8_68_21]